MYDCAHIRVHLEPLRVYGMAFFSVSLAHGLFNILALLVCYFAEQKIEERCVLGWSLFLNGESS